MGTDMGTTTARTAPIRLSVLDLVPIVSGSTVAEAVRRSVDLAQRAERAGYQRYWLAEHHLNPGVACSAPPLVISLVAAATEHIRVGAGAVQMGHQTPLAVVEQFGMLDALHPGRIDLGLGRSASRRPPADPDAPPRPPRTRPNGTEADGTERPGPTTTPGGLLVPRVYSLSGLRRSPRFRLQRRLLQQPGGFAPSYAEQVDEVLRLLAGDFHEDEAVVQAMPGAGAGPSVWVMGSSGGESAEVAGARSLPFGANYHVAPASVLDAVEAYRAAFRPSDERPVPEILVSADVLVADDEPAARRLATGHDLWVRSIRLGLGAIPYPTPAEAAAHHWTDEDRAMVEDRVSTRFVGTAGQVADGLEVLAAETGAVEVMVTTIAHDHEARARSFDLLAQEWARRGHRGAAIAAAARA